MIQPASAAAPPADAPDAGRAGRGAVPVGYLVFLLQGWTVLLVPSLIREVQRTFDQDDAGMGLAYLVNAITFVGGAMAVGVLSGRVQRRLLLASGPGLIAVGLAGIAVAGDWPLFLAGFLVTGIGTGLVDAGVNALFMDLFAGRAASLNRLHLFFALGALAVPLAVGAGVGAGVPWQAIVLGTAAVAIVLAVMQATRDLPAVHPVAGPVAGRETGDRARSRRRVPVPLALLAVAIGCYVAMEIGVSSWLVRYLEDAPLEIATLALSLFWASLALGRLVSSFIADRMGAVRFGATWSAACGAAIIGAIVVPVLPLSVAAFAVAGFAAGPVYPAIMAIGGALHPGRASAVSSVLASAAIVGSVVYPPLMGVVSEAAGLWYSMLGAALFGFGCAAAIVAAARLARRTAPAGALA